MKKRFFVVLLTIILIMSTGCQLAQEDSGTVVPTDQLVGMYVTLSDAPGYEWDAEATGLAEPLHYFASQGQRIYADAEYNFPEGMGLLATTYYVQTEDRTQSYWSSNASDGISDAHSSIYTENDVTSVCFEATIYVADTAGELSLFMNPVYQNANGQLYALGTAPMGYQAASMDGCAETISQEIQTDLGSEFQTSGGSVTMHIEVIQLPERYVLIQVSQDHALLRSEEFAPEEMPETYTPASDCAYLILESYSADGKVQRTAYSVDEGTEFMDIFYPMESGICQKGRTKIVWEGAQ